MNKKICKTLLIMCFFMFCIFVNQVQAQTIKIKDVNRNEVTTINCSVGDTVVVYQCINVTWDFYRSEWGVNYDDDFIAVDETPVDTNGIDWYVENMYTMTILKAGEITLGFYNNEKTGLFGMFSNSATANLKLIIKDPVAEAEDKKKEMEEAYKTVPRADADKDTIDEFIKSYARYVEGLSTEEEKTKAWDEFKEKVSKETATKWKNKISDAMNGRVERELYKHSNDLLNAYINDTGDFTAYSENLANQMNSAIDATSKTIEEIKMKIAELLEEGEDRKDNKTFNDIFDDINYYKPGEDTSDLTTATQKAGTVLGVITNIGMVLSVLMPAILGIKYMLGSVEEKADYKKDMIPYLVGAILLFGISVIVKVLQEIGKSFNNI